MNDDRRADARRHFRRFLLFQPSQAANLLGADDADLFGHGAASTSPNALMCGKDGWLIVLLENPRPSGMPVYDDEEIIAVLSDANRRGCKAFELIMTSEMPGPILCFRMLRRSNQRSSP